MAIPSIKLFESLYRYLSVRRKPLYIVTLLIIALSCVVSMRAHIEEDIVAMLPDDGSDVAKDFHLLQMAPFTRKVIVTLKTNNPADPAALTGAADRVAQSITAAGIGKVTTGPTDMSGNLITWLDNVLPSLTTPDDIPKLEQATTPAEVEKRVRESYERLLSPAGWAMKEMIQRDPLSFSTIGLQKLRFLNMIPNMRLVNNHFVSADGRSALIAIDSKVPMTDSAASRVLIDRLDKALKSSVPPGMSASVVSGHRYTLANAETIKHDLEVVLTVNIIAVLIIYILFLRSLTAFFVFLVPTSILVVASGITAISYGSVFALTLGFGGVVLGIADEYAMLVYFSCRVAGDRFLGTVTAETARPVLFAAAGTLISLGVMLISSLPGQRQLAVYSMTGIAASVLISLIVLPHLVGSAKQRPLPFPNLDIGWRLPRRGVLVCWVIILVICGWQATKVRFNGDLRTMNMVTPDLRQAEQEVARTWGDMRDKALIFAEGPDLESALLTNDALFGRISGKIAPGELVSLSPLLPSMRQQSENRARWRGFWNQGRVARLSEEVARAGAPLGFAEGAFAPFLSSLTEPAPAATVDGLRQAGMGELVDSLVIQSPGSVQVLTLVPDTPKVLTAISLDLKAVPGVHLVSQTRFGNSVGRAIVKDFKTYMIVTSVLVFALVVVLFRKPSRIALVLVPVITGVLCMLGIMGMLGMEFNIFNIAATVLIIGLCVDYGIFMVCRLKEETSHAANRAVLVSGLTTLAGLGSLALARHPSMHSIGITVLLGIGTGIPAALLVIPALCEKEKG
jgi:uncharacterized protein